MGLVLHQHYAVDDQNKSLIFSVEIAFLSEIKSSFVRKGGITW